LTVDARAVALVERAGVAVGGARRARSLLRVGRTVRPVAWAVLRQVTFPCRRPALDTRGFKAVGRAGRARAGAGLGHVARTRRRAHRPPVPCRVLTRDVGAIALVERAGVPVGGACRAARLVRVDGACAARRPRTVLRHVALAGGRPTHEGAGLEPVGRAAGARPRAEFVRITDIARASAAQRPGVPRRVLAGRSEEHTSELQSLAYLVCRLL